MSAAGGSPSPVTGASQQTPIHSAQKLQGAASRSYTVASKWEQSAALTSKQTSLIDQLSSHCSSRPLPNHVVTSERSPTKQKQSDEQAPSGKEDRPELDGGEALEDAVLQTSQKFYQWHAKLEAFRASEAEEKYREYADTLTGHQEACMTIGSVIDSTVEVLEGILAFHKDAVGRSQSLRETGERLVEERQQLIEFASAIRSRLSHFEELEKMASEFHNLASSQSSSRPVEGSDANPYLVLLKRLDESIAYVSSHSQYAEASLYMSQFKRLQAQALGGIRHHVTSVLKTSTQKFLESLPAEESNELEEGSEETSLLYVRFRALVEPSLKALLEEIESRREQPEYEKLLGDCQRAFCQARLTIMQRAVSKKVAALASQPFDEFIRNGFYFLVQVCRVEHQLFCRFFPASTTDLSILTSSLIDPLGVILYDALRPIIIQLQEVGQLCEVVEILKNEIIDEQMSRLGEVLEPLQPAVMKTLADAQERLTYRMQAFVREGITNYDPAEQDLNYPQCLEVSVSGGDAPKTDEGGSSEAEMAGKPGEELEKRKQDSSKWYPPLQMVLVYLSRLYHCLEPRIFGGLAHEAVLACAGSIAKAGRLVTQKSGKMDGQLFTVRHLLLLREEIAVFKAEFSVVEKDLDFSHMRDHMRRILMGEASLFTFSSNNAVVQLVSRGAPRVLDNQINSKKRLEKQLKEVCEELIMTVTKTTVEPMLSFITKVTIRGASNSTSNQSAQRPLRELAFASVDRVTEMVNAVNQSLKTTLPSAVTKMKLYLPNQGTHAILFKPIKSNIGEAHSQVASIFGREYEKEEVASVPLLAPKDLTELLDSLN